MNIFSTRNYSPMYEIPFVEWNWDSQPIFHRLRPFIAADLESYKRLYRICLDGGIMVNIFLTPNHSPRYEFSFGEWYYDLQLVFASLKAFYIIASDLESNKRLDLMHLYWGNMVNIFSTPNSSPNYELPFGE